MKISVKNFYKPTPVPARKWGDGLLYFCAGLTPFVALMPIDGDTAKWINVGIGILGLAAKTFSNMFKDESLVATEKTDNI